MCATSVVFLYRFSLIKAQEVHFLVHSLVTEMNESLLFVGHDSTFELNGKTPNNPSITVEVDLLVVV